jgi:hypothetical protein
MKALRRARRLDLIRNVLRGPNPEARFYAMTAIERLRAATPEDRAVFTRIKALPIKITNCTGCMFSSGSTEDARRAVAE